MERELWPELYRAVKEVGKLVRQKGVQYQPWVIALVYLWAALHERPVGWACVAAHWSTTRQQPLAVPSAATLSRRAYSVAMGVFWRALEDHLRQSGVPGLLSFADGKPLVVGNATKDHDARKGWATSGFAKGYRLHALQGTRCLPEAWDVTSLNVSESVVAQSLVRQAHLGGYLLVDGAYDSGPLFECAQAAGYQLLAPAGSDAAGRGHRRLSAARQRGLELARGSFGRELLAQRRRIEQAFGNLTSFGGGLAPLSAWVRHQNRVRTWVWAKLLINAIRIQRLQKQQLTTRMK
jgi:hypothetical protein